MTKRYSLVADSLGLEPNLIAVSAAIFLMAFGENLWKQFVPKYLEALGAPVLVIGLYGTARDFLDGVYQYPGGWIADRCFSLFPVAVVLASSFASLVVAFIIGGLREIGEPARKAIIMDFATPPVRARTVGLYYLVRSLAIAPAAALGGLLWQLAPHAPFIAAGIIGMIGTVIFAATVEERYAG